MIDRDEIHQKVDELGVNTSNVQRDYVFGWLLAGIYGESQLGRLLVLKGGNCFRKAYFPFARFSSDLDFSTPGAIEPSLLHDELNRVCALVSANTGVQFDVSRTLAQPKRRVDDSIHVMEARIYFQDFYGNKDAITIKIAMDITEFDRLHLPVQTRRLIHDYSDYDKCSAELRCVKLEEQLASKMKCLLQRRHVADLFDLVFSTIIHPEFEVNRSEVIGTFFRKTIFGREPGVAKGLFLNLPMSVFQPLWEKHIVSPAKSKIDFSQVGEVLSSLIMSLFVNTPVVLRHRAFFPADFRNPIMEAGHTTTLLKVKYHGKTRLVEPYSLDFKIRQDGVGREYFFVYDRTGGSSGPGIKALVAEGVQSIENTDEEFEPRHPVEIKKAGEVTGPLYFTGRPSGEARSRLRRSKSIGARIHSVKCSTCGKVFRRKKLGFRLNPHVDKFGNRCLGRMGHSV